MKRAYRLLDLYKKPRIEGIFYSMSKNEKLKSIFELLGYEENDYHKMDFEYMYNHSGLKTASVLVEELLRGYIIDDDENFVTLSNGKRVTWEYVMTQVDEDIINFVIEQKFYLKWKGLIETVKADFDALSPYNMTYDKVTNDELHSTNENKGSKDTSGSSSDNSEGSTKTDDSTYGFNSTSAVPTDESADTTKVKRDISDTTHSENEDSTTYERKNMLNTTIIRKGNIGNKSSQQLIEEQRNMLQWQLYNVIFDDLDSVLTRSKYI